MTAGAPLVIAWSGHVTCTAVECGSVSVKIYKKLQPYTRVYPSGTNIESMISLCSGRQMSSSKSVSKELSVGKCTLSKTFFTHSAIAWPPNALMMTENPV